MNPSPLITIIVPTYNLDKYLDRCLSSILLQSYPYWECIIINDRSTDQSEKIAKKWCNKDSRFIYLLNEKNIGLSLTRNKGIDSANGEFITFIDADDWVETHFLQQFINNLDNENTLLVQDIILDYPNHSERYVQKYKGETLNLPKDLQKFISNYRYTQGYAWNKLFNVSIIKQHNLYYYKDVANEDEIFYFEYIRHINKVTFIGNAQYHYIQRELSLSKTYQFLPFYNYLKKTIDIVNFLEKILETNREGRKYSKKRFNAVFQLCLRNAIYHNNYLKEQRIQCLKMLKEILDNHKELVQLPKSLPKKIDLFLLKNGLFVLADLFLKFRTKR